MALNVPNADYWLSRHEQWIKNQDKMDNKVTDKLKVDYNRTAKALEREIAEYFQRYGEQNVMEFRVMLQQLDSESRTMLFEEMERFAQKYPQYVHLLPIRESIYKLNRLQGLHYSTQLKLLELGAIEQEVMVQHLERTYLANYEIMLGELGLGHKFLALDKEVIQTTIFKKWVAGDNFSGRIWANKDKLYNHLTTVYRDSLARGDNYATMVRDLRERFNVGVFDAKRLIWTESSFVLNQSHAKAYIESGTKEYVLNAMMDHRTSVICKAINGKRFKFDDMTVGVNFPPLHTFCRTTFIGG